MTARIVKLILTDDVLLGKGADGSFLRKAWTFYTLDGEFIGQYDPHPEEGSPRKNPFFNEGTLHAVIQEGR